VQSLSAVLEPTVVPAQSWSWIRSMTSFRYSKEVKFAFLFGAGQKGGSEVAPVRSNWKSTTPFNEQDLICARDLTRGGAEKIYKELKGGVRWMGDEKPLPMQIKVVREVSDREDSDDDEMEI
jgi:hypothetical protein